MVWRKIPLLWIPIALFGQAHLAPHSLLYQAECLSKKYNLEIAKTPPPLTSPQTQSCLDTASVFFTIDLKEISSPAFETLNDETLWNTLREIGVEGVYLKGLKKGGSFRTGIGIDPKWGDNWDDLAITMQKKGIILLGDSLGNSTGLSPDFWLALKNIGDYPSLYHLIEVEKRDWKLLPPVSAPQFTANVPWLTLQELHKKGYVPEQFQPYVKTSQWNATSQIKCEDGKVRRWIYLKENESDPVIDWLNPSFAGCKIAAADALDSIFNLGQKMIHFDAAIRSNAKETLTLWVRKLGGYSLQDTNGTLDELKQNSADLLIDTPTRPALLHALLAQDAEALKLMYRLYLEEGIQTKRLVHILQPIDQSLCDWSELLQNPRKRFQYYDEILTAEALRTRLLKQDAASFAKQAVTTWPTLCINLLGIKDFEKKWEDITDIHLLLAFFYAMQPGAFSFSVSDLLGMLTHQPVNLMEPNENTVYASLPGQMQNQRSFAAQLKKILAVRRDSAISGGELIAIPKTTQPGLFILIHRLPGTRMLQLLAVNFGRTAAQQALEIPEIRETTAIDLMTGLAEKKPLDSSTIRLQLPAWSGKVILFQPKYF